jgi:arylsulfatase
LAKKERAVFTSWYGQANRTAGRASFITGHIPIRSALSIVAAPVDENFLRSGTPTIAECLKKGDSTFFSGKWHLGDKFGAYPTEHGFDEMNLFPACHAGVYSYNDTDKWFHSWFASFNPEFEKIYNSVVNLGVLGEHNRTSPLVAMTMTSSLHDRQPGNAKQAAQQISEIDDISVSTFAGRTVFVNLE